MGGERIECDDTILLQEFDVSDTAGRRVWRKGRLSSRACDLCCEYERTISMQIESYVYKS